MSLLSFTFEYFSLNFLFKKREGIGIINIYLHFSIGRVLFEFDLIIFYRFFLSYLLSSEYARMKEICT